MSRSQTDPTQTLPIRRAGLLLPLLLLISPLLAAQPEPADPATTTEEQPTAATVPQAPEVGAKGYLLMDHDSGVVLAQANADARLEPASLTKIMTAYVVFHELAEGKLKLDDMALVSEKAWRTGGSRMYIEVNTQVSIEDLLHGMIVQSGNDASIALAEHVAGSEDAFAELMNRHARRLGMTNTHFTNATGLPGPEHYTTPRDILKVTAATIREFPQYYAWYRAPEFTFNNINQRNRNKLLFQDDSVDGVKTGHTEAAGYCLVASARRDHQRLTSVVMGTDSETARARDSLALLNWGFRFFETAKLYEAGQQIETLRIWSGADTELPVGPADDLYVTFPRGRYQALAGFIENADDIQAPVSRGQQVGDIVLELDGETLLRVPLVALAAVEEGGIFRKAIDSVLRLF